MMIGQTVSHFEILERLGQGGMGVVYKARDLKLDRGNICTIYEIGEAEDGRTFIAMAFCDGETLAGRIRRGPLPLDAAVNIASQIARGPGEAHARGITHRDIKPANIAITKDGTVKILDFGVATLAGATRITKVDSTSGTVAYMSPEQARGDPVDQRTDLWSLFGTTVRSNASSPRRGESTKPSRSGSFPGETSASAMTPARRARPQSAAAWVEPLLAEARARD